MKTRYSCIFGIMAMLMLVSSFVIPGKLVNPTPVSADPGLMEWTIVDTMDSTPGTGSVYSPVPPLGMYEYGSEFIKLVVGNNNNTMWAIVRIGYSGSGATCAKDSDNGNIVALRSTNGGQTWSATPFGNLKTAMALTAPQITTAWDVAIAPDNPNLVALAVSRKPTLTTYSYALEVWISEDGGTTWQNTQWPPAGATGFTASINYFISDMQISMDYGGARDLMIGTRGTPTSTKNVQIMKIPSYGGWRCQDLAGSTSTEQWAGDVLALRFSPTYVGDATLAVVTANATGTYLVTGAHDLSQNRTDWQPNGSWVEVKDGTSAAGASPNAATIINADLELPSDFSGQSTSLRRFYISTDALTGAGLAAAGKDVGVFRVDDNIVYTLMDNTNTSYGIGNVTTRRAHSISYWGTYASGKLLAGEHMGHECTLPCPPGSPTHRQYVPSPAGTRQRNRSPAREGLLHQ